MANLLPVSEKKRIHKEYRIRLGVVSALFLAGLIAISIILFTPSFVLSSIKYNDTIVKLETEKKKISNTIDGIDPIKIAEKVNKQLVVLGQDSSLLPLSYDIFTTIVGHKTEKVKIDSILYDRGKKEGRISLSGVSENRETLLSFLQSLETEKMFDKVELPISSFVEGEDIKFTIRIKIEDKSPVKDDKNNENEEQ